jgi:soluble lytic murein transglycosylase-like protein
MRFAVIPALSLALASFCPAGEIAVLASGMQLRIDRHERVGDRVRLYSASGVTELSAAEVVEFERVAEPPPPPSPTPAAATEPAPPKVELSPRELVEQAAVKHGLPPEFVHLVARAESGFNPKAVSPKGAIGLMQLMPATAAQLKVDPNDPSQNAEGGVRLLRELLIRYQDHPDQVRRALAAYNAGEGAVARYGGVPPYRETQNYVHKIVEQYKRIARPE